MALHKKLTIKEKKLLKKFNNKNLKFIAWESRGVKHILMADNTDVWFCDATENLDSDGKIVGKKPKIEFTTQLSEGQMMLLAQNMRKGETMVIPNHHIVKSFQF